MTNPRLQHFDVEALCQAVCAQPIGLRISTNHPHGFKRLLYAFLRKRKEFSISLLQCPKSANALLLVKADFKKEPTA